MRVSSARLVLLLALIAGGALCPPAGRARPASPATAAAPAALAGEVPLPGGCGGVTPSGEPPPVCCVSGVVFFDGQPVAGAEVQLETARGDQLTLFTRVYSGTETRPYYRVNLGAPLDVQPGEPITLTARYSGHSASLRHTALAGGQQVDIVLARAHADDYGFARQIWGQGQPGRFNRPRGVAVDADHQMYVVDTDNARVQVLSPAGAFVREWGELGNLPGQLNQPGGIALDPSGNVYVADTNNHRVQKFSAHGGWLASWGGFGDGPGQLNAPWGVAVGPYGAIYVADSGNDRVQKWSDAGAWLASWGGFGSGPGQLSRPTGLALDADGAIYIADSGNNRVQKWSDAGAWLASWGGPGSGPGQLNAPWGIAVSTAGVVAVADSGNDRVQRWTTAGSPLAGWGAPGSANGQLATPTGLAADGATIVLADTGNARVQSFSSAGAWQASWGGEGDANGQLRTPSGVALGGGSLYVADTGNARVQKFSLDGGWQATFGSAGASNGQLAFPWGLAADAGGVWVADSGNNRVQRFSGAGAWQATFGAGLLDTPYAVALGAGGSLYLADSGNGRIQKLSAAGAPLASWGTQGSGPEQLANPHGVAVDSGGALVVADTNNHRIQRISAAGAWLPSLGGFGSAPGQLSSPGAVALDAAGNLLVADTGNDRLQKYGPGGALLAGWSQRGSAAGQLREPRGLAVGADGQVFVADSGNNRVVVFRPLGYTLPIATIVQLSSAELGPGETLTAIGVGQDSDETPALSAYRWTSSRDGVIGAGATLTRAAASLTPGSHTLTFEVRDGEGQWSAPVSTRIYVAPQPREGWTMLLYLAGDYPDGGWLARSYDQLLARLRRAFANADVRIAIQLDGPANGDTRRILITPGAAPGAAQVVEQSVGELAMDRPQTLADFLRWGQSSFPATRYYLSIADHGQAIVGTAWDGTSDSGGAAYLTVQELGQALAADGVAPFEIVQLDASSMNVLETAFELRGQTRVLIASQNLAWNYLAYETYQGLLHASGATEDAARGITAAYAARAEADHAPYTIAALDMARAEPTISAVDQLAIELAAWVNNDFSRRAQLDAIWSASQKFESSGDLLIGAQDVYVDLADWARRVAALAPSPAVYDRAAALVEALTGAHPFVLAGSQHAAGGELPPQYAGGATIDLSGSTGLSIFYPQRLDTVAAGDYLAHRLFRFTRFSHWPELLTAGLAVLPPPDLPAPGPLAPLAPPWHVFFPIATLNIPMGFECPLSLGQVCVAVSSEAPT